MVTLSSEQQAAVLATEPRVLVLAGAGSGKTRVMERRVTHLVKDRGVSPFEIMPISFTRLAAEELRSRLAESIGPSMANKLHCGTLHGVSLSMLQRFGELVDTRCNSVYGPWEELVLVEQVAREMGVYTGKKWNIPKKKILACIDARYTLRKPPELKESEQADVEVLINNLGQRLRQYRAYTYGGLMIGMRTLAKSGILGTELTIRHIMVDEVQDLDRMQWEIVNTLASTCGAHICCVGDVDQSIYSFRGAVPGYLIQHADSFKIYHLSANYRSRPAVVRAANSLIEHNTQRLPHTMEPKRGEAESAVTTIYNMDTAALASHIASLPPELRPNAVLCRVNVMLRKLETHLRNIGVSARFVGKATQLTDSPGFKRVHAMLKLAVNPLDDFSFLLARPMLQVGDEEYAAIRAEVGRTGMSEAQAYMALRGQSICYTAPGESPSEAVNDAVALGMSSGVLQDGENFEIMEFSAQYAAKFHRLQDYLSWLATWDVQDEVRTEDEKDENAIQLLSIHAAKGLEWPRVVLWGCNMGVLPYKMAGTPEAMEDERRVAYVGMTRAEDHLVLAVRPDTPPSGFLLEALETPEAASA